MHQKQALFLLILFVFNCLDKSSNFFDNALLYKFFSLLFSSLKNDYVFKHSCEKGHIEIVKWLWSLDGKINIHADDEYAFKYACSKGHIEIVKWLLSIDNKINIRDGDDDAFRFACRYKNIEIIKLLISLCDDYIVTIVDDILINWSIRPNIFLDVIINNNYERLIKKNNMIKIHSYNKYECQICMSKCKNIIKLKCSHTFCIESLSNWILHGEKNTCPVCRVDINLTKSCIYL